MSTNDQVKWWRKLFSGTSLEVVHKLATIVVAVIAVAGFAYSIRSSQEVSEALAPLTTALEALETPLVGLDNFTFHVDGVRSCDNPPQALFFDLRNASILPIVIESDSFEFSYGDRRICEPEGELGGDSIILAPGQRTTSGQVCKKDLPEVLGEARSVVRFGPGLNLKYKAVLSPVRDDRLWDYRVTHSFFYDCRTGKFRIETVDQDLSPRGETEAGM